MIYATSWGVQGMLPHPAFSRLLCTWTYWGSLFHVFKQGWWLGTPKFSFETADVDNDNSLYLKKWQIFVTNSDARIYVLYLHFFLCFHWGQGNVSWFLLRMWNMGQFPLCFGSMWSTSIFPISSFSNNCKKWNRKKGLYFEMVRLNVWYRQVTFPFYQSLIIEHDKVNTADSASKSMVRLVRAEKMVLSGLVFARKIARMICIQNI